MACLARNSAGLVTFLGVDESVVRTDPVMYLGTRHAKTDLSFLPCPTLSRGVMSAGVSKQAVKTRSLSGQ